MNKNIVGNNHAFIEKTKKQAKKLLKLAQNSQLNITNLASAQEILAQVNGYPHWHAFETTMRGDKTSAIESDKMMLDKSVEGIYYHESDKIISLLEITYLNLSDLQENLYKFSNKMQFQLNMGFHELKLCVANHYSDENIKNYSFHSVAAKLNISETLAKKLFKFDINIEKKSGYYLSATLMVSTQKDMLDEHIEVCKNLLSFEDISFAIKQVVSAPDHKAFFSPQSDEFFGISDMPCRNLLHALALLQKKDTQFNIVLDIKNMCFSFHSEKESLYTYVKGLYKAFKEKSEISEYKIPEFENKQKDSTLDAIGIPLINHTNENILHYDPYKNHNKLIFAGPGSGKSILMSVLNLYSLREEIPYIGIVDIGPSSRGVVSLIKEALQTDKKHLAQYYKIRMTREYCVNPFDTQLGCRFPSSEEKAFLSNFLLLLLTDLNQHSPENGMTGLVQTIIENMYKKTSEKGTPKRYDRGVNKLVDEALAKIRMSIDDKITWWEIVDNLFDNGYIHEAMLAQRNAVPLLVDALFCAQEEEICDIYSKVTVYTGENIIRYFNRSIKDCLEQYNILTQPTVFDIGEARIVSLDLDEVARSGGPSAEKQTAVMYMIARYILGKSYKSNPDNISSKYILYHQAQKSATKFLCYDEFHRTSRSFAVKEQVKIDMREGRKWNMHVTLASQSIKDFDETMLSFSNAIFILDASYNSDEITDVFNLNQNEKNLLKKTHGPRSSKPGVFLAKFFEDGKRVTKLLSFQHNPYLINALSGMVEDVVLKEELLKHFSYEKVLDLLIENFPEGVRKAIENLYQARGETQDRRDFIRQIAQEIIRKN